MTTTILPLRYVCVKCKREFHSYRWLRSPLCKPCKTGRAVDRLAKDICEEPSVVRDGFEAMMRLTDSEA